MPLRPLAPRPGARKSRIISLSVKCEVLCPLLRYGPSIMLKGGLRRRFDFARIVNSNFNCWQVWKWSVFQQFGRCAAWRNICADGSGRLIVAAVSSGRSPIGRSGQAAYPLRPERKPARWARCLSRYRSGGTVQGCVIEKASRFPHAPLHCMNTPSSACMLLTNRRHRRRRQKMIALVPMLAPWAVNDLATRARAASPVVPLSRHPPACTRGRRQEVCGIIRVTGRYPLAKSRLHDSIYRRVSQTNQRPNRPLPAASRGYSAYRNL